MSNVKSIGILGSGTWGVALARLLQRNGHHVTVWSKFQQEVDALSGQDALTGGVHDALEHDHLVVGIVIEALVGAVLGESPGHVEGDLGIGIGLVFVDVADQLLKQ